MVQFSDGRIIPEDYTESFDTSLGEVCLAFSIENRGNSILVLTLDNLHQLRVLPNTSRDWDHIPGMLYKMDLKGAFKPDPAQTEAQVNEISIIRTVLNC